MKRSLFWGLALVAVLVALVVAVLGDRLWPTKVVVRWSTATEIAVAGFNLSRAETPTGPFEQVNPQMIPARGDELTGAEYVFEDTTVQSGRTYYYRLEEVDMTGNSIPQGMVEVRAGGGWQSRWAAALALLLAGGILFRLGWLEPTARRNHDG